MRLQEGQAAPAIRGETTRGMRIAPEAFRGKTVLLKFYRFAHCPICNLHIREYVRRAAELRSLGITVVTVFHSPSRKLQKSLRKLDVPFDVIADPAKSLFRQYGVESSLRGMFSLRVWREYARAAGAGFFSRPLGHEGGVRGHPADFLIDEAGVVRIAHYGQDYADTLEVDSVIEAAVSMGLGNSGIREDEKSETAISLGRGNAH